MADKPHLGQPPVGDVLPSWQRSTEPESRWPAFAAVVIIIAGQTWVATSFSLRPIWLYPTIAGILLLASVAVYIPSRTEPGRALRAVSLGLVAVLVIANIVSVVLLVRGVFVGPLLSPTGLLLAGAVLWVVNVAMPYSKRAKLVMGVENTISLVIAAMLVARAINIARG